MENDRWRLIHGLSLEDQMVDKVLFYPWYASEVRQPMSVTSKGGWSPLPAGYQRMAAEFPSNESVAVDKTCWDWTMLSWVIWAYVDMKRSQCVDWDDFYEWLVWSRLYFVLGPGAKFRLSDGRELRQTFWGLMKSGWLLTLSLNSAAQHFQHALAWFRLLLKSLVTGPCPPIWAMGDDVLARMSQNAEFIHNYLQELRTTGCIVKKAELRREFAGFDVIGDGADIVVQPLYPERHKATLAFISPDVEQETLFSYSLLYALATDDWLEPYWKNLNVPVGPSQRMWARGLSSVPCLQTVPAWANP